MVISVTSFLSDHPIVLNEEEHSGSNDGMRIVHRRKLSKSKVINAFNDCSSYDVMQSDQDIAAAAAIAAGEEVTEGNKPKFHSKIKRKYKNNVVVHGSRIVQQVSASKASDEEDCKEAALRLLDYAPRSVEDMRQRLTEKGYAEVAINAVIQRLIELHFLDDNQYAKAVIRSCVSRMLGARATRMELQRKNVDSSAISSCISEAQELGMFTEAAWELGRKTVQRTKRLDPLVRRRRFFAAAARKGHDLSIINEVYNALFTNSEEE